MKDKTQYEALVEELQKIVENFRDGVIEIEERLSKLLPDIEIPEEEEEDTWKMKYPYEEGEKYWVLYDDGTVNLEAWLEYGNECNTFNQGNAFQTKEEAELESKRRNLLTRFRAFRDECNGNWKINWKDTEQAKYIVKCDNEGDLYVVSYWTVNEFSLFGYFKDYNDTQRAIELFGVEIIELFMNCEV